jgi:hypothetical protein
MESWTRLRGPKKTASSDCSTTALGWSAKRKPKGMNTYHSQGRFTSQCARKSVSVGINLRAPFNLQGVCTRFYLHQVSCVHQHRKRRGLQHSRYLEPCGAMLNSSLKTLVNGVGGARISMTLAILKQDLANKVKKSNFQYPDRTSDPSLKSSKIHCARPRGMLNGRCLLPTIAGLLHLVVRSLDTF